ncbi:DUF523 domain-containing protein [Candidatus Omnitrophota bacterium]
MTKNHRETFTPTYSKILVSACLAGMSCSFDGKSRLNKHIKRLTDRGEAVAVCPELLGGLGAPRESSEIAGGDGSGVLAGSAKVLTGSGKDVSRKFIKGAGEALKVAKIYRSGLAILKSKSPSCGRGRIYDGRFRGRLKKGDGVAASLLSRNGITVISEKNLKSSR